MDTSKVANFLQRFLSRPPEFEPDYPLDNRIRDALFEDSLAHPSAGAWERLRRHAMIEREYRRSGMWLLNEPLRDPPEAPPLQLNHHDYKRALRIYTDQTAITNQRNIMMYKSSLWDGMIPSVSALLNW